MPMERPSRHSARTSLHAQILALLVLLGCLPPPSEAGQFSVPITVRVVLSSDTSGICRSSNQIGAFGAAITIVCATGTPAKFSGDAHQLPWSSAQDGPFRYLTLRSVAGEFLGSVESHTGSGITNSWNVVRVNDREYLEFMVSW